jgi:hypothetical protein
MRGCATFLHPWIGGVRFQGRKRLCRHSVFGFGCEEVAHGKSLLLMGKNLRRLPPEKKDNPEEVGRNTDG